jgi:dTDP-4-dehydrorhamnose 3,5-epimerase
MAHRLVSPEAGDVPLDGVLLHRLTAHADHRGSFTEAFRREWDLGVDPVQWNVVKSNAGAIRGVHVHPRHTDMLVVTTGRVTIGLHDLREGSPTKGRSATFSLTGENLGALLIPPGVAHGFLFHEPTVTVYAVSHYWDTEDELAVHWADPGLGIDWPFTPSLVSDRDAAAGTLSALIAQLVPLQPIGR